MQRHSVHTTGYVHTMHALSMQPRCCFDLLVLLASEGCLCIPSGCCCYCKHAALLHWRYLLCFGIVLMQSSWQWWVKIVHCNAGSLSAPLTKARSTSCQRQYRSRSTSCTSGILLAWLGRARTPRAWKTSTKPSWQNLVARTPESWVAQVSPPHHVP